MKMFKKGFKKPKKTKIVCVIFDTNGKELSRVRLKGYEKTFKYRNKAYLFDKDSTHIKIRKWIRTDYIYFYSVNKKEPLLLKETPSHTEISSDFLYDLLENDLARKLSDTGKQNILTLFRDNPTALIILIIVIGIIGYVMFQGGLI